MTTQLDEKLSGLVKYQLPEFVRDNYATFQTFLEEYYKFSEQTTEVQYNIQKAKSFANIDETANSFVDYFLNQYAYNLPKSIFKDQLNQQDGLVSNTIESKRAIAKRLTEYHASKGTEGAIKLLFRLLFDDEITFYYPKEDMFRPSDAEWIDLKTIFLYSPTGNITISDYGGASVVGLSSGASVILNDLESLNYFDGGNVALYEMSVENDSISDKQFELGEIVQLRTANLTTGNFETVANLKFYNAISSFNIVDPGIGYDSNTIIYVNSVAAENFIGQLDKVGDIGQVKKISITRPVDLLTEYNSLSNISVLFNDVLSEHSGKFETSLTGNVATITLFESGNSITHGLTEGSNINVRFTSGLVIGSNTYAVKSILSSKRFTISNVRLTGNITGNAVVEARSINALPVLGAIANYSGESLNKNSHVSDIKKIQDSYYYQDYSYVIRANQSSSLWKDIIRKSVHPAGMRLISQVFLTLANAFTATSVTPRQAIGQALMRIQVVSPRRMDIPPSVITNLIIKSVGRVSRNVYKHRSSGFFYRDLDQFKFKQLSSLHIYDFANLTTGYLYENYSNLTLPQIHLSADISQGGPNIILNSRFSSASDWVLGSGFSINSSNLEATAASSNVVQQISTEANSKYMATYEILSSDSGSVALASNTFVGTSRSSPGYYSELFWVPSSSANIVITASGFTGNISNVYVKKLVTLLG
jgi:hypothetical protein